MPLSTVEVGPDDASAAVVWLHGLGADGHDFEPIVPILGLPHVRFVFPSAEERPVSINNGHVMRAWYDIHPTPDRFVREELSDIEVSHEAIVELLQREQVRGVSPERLVLAGFSQGGGMAYYSAHRLDHTLAGLLALSTYLVGGPELPRGKRNHEVPLFSAHGSHDPVVPLDWGREAFTTYDRPERDTTWMQYGMGHEVCGPQLRDVASWLSARLPA